MRRCDEVLSKARRFLSDHFHDDTPIEGIELIEALTGELQLAVRIIKDIKLTAYRRDPKDPEGAIHKINVIGANYLADIERDDDFDEDALQAQIDADMRGAGVSLSDAIIEERREGP